MPSREEIASNWKRRKEETQLAPELEGLFDHRITLPAFCCESMGGMHNALWRFQRQESLTESIGESD
jgi:hypothetical protein